jgi:hypothetical protein
MIMMMEISVEWLARETELLGENLPQCRFVHHKSHMLSGCEPGQEYLNLYMGNYTILQVRFNDYLNSFKTVYPKYILITSDGMFIVFGYSVWSARHLYLSNFSRATACPLVLWNTPFGLHVNITGNSVIPCTWTSSVESYTTYQNLVTVLWITAEFRRTAGMVSSIRGS